MTVDYRVGDTREVIKDIADGSVDLIASSPPFLALRSYVPADHVSKGNEIGSERNPAEFIDMLLGLTAEWGRVLAPHGSIAIELGDTYSGSGGAGGDYTAGGLRDGQAAFDGSASRITRNAPRYSAATGNIADARGGTADVQMRNSGGTGWPLAKSLCLIPQLYAIALAYGINPLTGQASPAGRWRVRNVIVWHRPNPAVGALGDKVRPSTSYIVVATRSAKRWFDLTAVRTPHVNDRPQLTNGQKNAARGPGDGMGFTQRTVDPAGAPPLDAWFDEYDEMAQIVGGEVSGPADAASPAPSTLSPFDPYDGSHDTWTLTTQPSRISMPIVEQVPCGPHDGGERTTSPDCPVHGDRAALASTERCDEPQSDQSPSHTLRTDVRHDRERHEPDADDVSTRSCSEPPATCYDTESSRTDPAPLTSPLDTPSAGTVRHTTHTSTSPEFCGGHPGTSASSNGEACPPADGHETAPHSDHTSDPESACTCTFHLEKHSIHSHYAMWPAKLAERLVLSMCPREVCRICHEPRRRVEGRTPEYAAARAAIGDFNTRPVGSGSSGSRSTLSNAAGKKITCAENVTLGWTNCGCKCPTCDGTGAGGEGDRCWGCDDGRAFRPGHVLDPFGGSGTTGAVADLHGRDATLIDFDARNKAIYPARYDEVKRALYGTPAPMPGQEAFDFEVPA